jgi:hypothetical protein
MEIMKQPTYRHPEIGTLEHVGAWLDGRKGVYKECGWHPGAVAHEDRVRLVRDGDFAGLRLVETHCGMIPEAAFLRGVLPPRFICHYQFPHRGLLFGNAPDGPWGPKIPAVIRFAAGAPLYAHLSNDTQKRVIKWNPMTRKWQE